MGIRFSVCAYGSDSELQKQFCFIQLPNLFHILLVSIHWMVDQVASLSSVESFSGVYSPGKAFRQFELQT